MLLHAYIHLFLFVFYKSAISNGSSATAEVEVEEIDVKVITFEGKEVIGKLRFTMTVGDEETLIKFEITNNIFGETPLTPDFWTEYSENTDNPNSRVMGIGQCLSFCKKEREEVLVNLAAGLNW